MRILVPLVACAVLAGCYVEDPEPEERIDFERVAQFSTEYLRVHLTLEDGRQLSVNTLDDVDSVEEFVTPIPGHQGRAWRFQQDKNHGTSLVYAAVSYDADDPADYLMAGYWAYYPDQHPPDLDPFDTVEYSIVDGPEFDIEDPPEMPVAGTASYAGLAGGIYAYAPGETREERHFVFDGFEGLVTLDADFGAGTVGGCIGCAGDLAIRTAIAPASRGDVQHDISDYEIHLEEQPFGTGHFFDGTTAVHHPARDVVFTEGEWGGRFSNRPDDAGDPRIVTGFSDAYFGEADDSVGYFFGSFVGMSEVFLSQD